ncbi:tetraspanin-17-like [Mya arenaria]|uniref:tetraspanin-17-like n=1 Tax=Mya arenaria TaxID=6604 RepID=UPI0022DFBE3D|nr:tetraspanin-17-like [Mya arenaria]
MPRKRRRDSTEVSCMIKYLMFGFNVLFWLIGTGICAIGLWAWTEKDMFTNIGRLTNVALDPAMVFIMIGGVMFIIGFAGCIGALRENTKLLLFFSVCVGLIFTVELVFAILAFVYKGWVQVQIETQIHNMIVNYRDDPDLQNLVDWVQKDWLKCCGVTDYRDWEMNIYFNCTSPGGEACGVPFSCCKPTDAVIANRHCGYEIMKSSNDFKRAGVIYTEGCIPSGQMWFEKNLIPVASVAVALAVLQILGICFAHNLRGDINRQKSRWRH